MAPTLTQEVADTELVEPVQVGMGERVGGVDPGDELLHRRLDLLVGGDVGVGVPRRPRTHVDGLGDLTGDLARLGDVGRHQCQPELGHQPEVGGVRVADHLATQLDAPAVGELGLLDPAPHAVTGLEHRDARAAGLEVSGGGETGQSRADHHDVGHDSSTVCSGSQPICTREPGVQRSPVLIRGRFCSRTVRVTPGATSMRYCVVAPW